MWLWNILKRFAKKSIATNKSILTKKAVFVGLDHYKMPGNDLNGCVLDAMDTHDTVVKFFGFLPDNIRAVYNQRATKEAILERLNWLVTNNQHGDELLYYHSGHGTQVRDRNGDELEDHMDEVFVTYDFDWDNCLLLDDDFSAVLDQLEEGVNLTIIIDTCHSGTITRAFGTKSKFIDPPLDIKMRENASLIINKAFTKTNVEFLQLSSCQDDQTSQETQMTSGKIRGIFTYTLMNVLRENPDKTWQEIFNLTITGMNGYAQTPVITGDKFLSRKPFSGA